MYHPVYGRLRSGPSGYYVNRQGELIPKEEMGHKNYSTEYSNPRVAFGSGFTPKELVSSGIVSGIIASVLGAGLPGALVMAIGSIIVEAGSTNIPPGWKRYVLGLFRTPHH